MSVKAFRILVSPTVGDPCRSSDAREAAHRDGFPGLADRVQSDVDRRRRALHATPEGVAFLDRLITEVRELEDTLLSAVPPDELARFEVTLEKIFASCTRESLGEARVRNLRSNLPHE